MNWKAVIFVAVLIGLLIVSVLGWHWTDTAKTQWWWTFWPIAAVVSAIAFIGLIIWFGKTQNKW